MIRFLLLLLMIASPAAAQPRANAIQPELVAEGTVRPGGEVELAIVMHTRQGWHGYWRNPGDAGLPMKVEWQVPGGVSLGPLRYPVPERLTIAGLMNYVYERDHAILVRLKAPPNASGSIPIRAEAQWLACTDKVCVPERGSFSAVVPVGSGNAEKRARFDEWRRALPRPLTSPARFEVAGESLRVAVPLPATATLRAPYVFPISEGAVDYAAEQGFRRSGDWVIAELKRKGGGTPRSFQGLLALGDGRGLEFTARPGEVPGGGAAIGAMDASTLLWAVLGALAGGLLLNLMPCVFPILALKALALAKAGGEERQARRDAWAYTAGAVVGTGALGAVLLAIRAGGTAAGWAFQLQDPRTTLLLMLLAAAITMNLLGLFHLPAFGGRARPTGSFATGALAAFVATPCAGPFLGTALGAALLLPLAGSIIVFAALGLGLAIPFLLIAFVPALRERLPRPGPWMRRLQRFLAIPMAATAAACLWLLWRQGGADALLTGAAALVLLALVLTLAGRRQEKSGVGLLPVAATAAIAAAAILIVPASTSAPSRPPQGAQGWSEQRVAEQLQRGRPVFVYFTADWCLTCKANEAAAIERDAVRKAFRQAGVRTLVGDWTNGDPAITRFLESRGRAGVPLYLWYEPGKAAEELPQLLTPAMRIDRARRPRPRS